MDIRDAAAGDMAGIRELLLRCDLPDDDIDPGRTRFLVAVAEGKIVGTVGLESWPPVGLLRSAAVDPSYRGQGIGRRLVDGIVAAARREGLGKMVLLTTTAEKFFHDAGFRKIDRGTLGGPVLGSAQLSGSRCASAAVMTLDPGAYRTGAGEPVS